MPPGPITCDGCGRTWFCRVHGDHTTCKECRKVVYVPPELRSGPGRRARTGNPIGRPREPKPDKAPRSVTTMRQEPPRQDPVAIALGYATAAAKVLAARRARQGVASPAPTRAASLAKQPAPLRPGPPPVSRMIPAGSPAYRLILANCRCTYGWPSPELPAEVVCRRHGRQRVESSASADGWGRLPVAVVPSQVAFSLHGDLSDRGEI
jgi:hypothetical protein